MFFVKRLTRLGRLLSNQSLPPSLFWKTLNTDLSRWLEQWYCVIVLALPVKSPQSRANKRALHCLPTFCCYFCHHCSNYRPEKLQPTGIIKAECTSVVSCWGPTLGRMAIKKRVLGGFKPLQQIIQINRFNMTKILQRRSDQLIASLFYRFFARGNFIISWSPRVDYSRKKSIFKISVG